MKPINTHTESDLADIVPVSSGASDHMGAKYATAPDGEGSPWVIGVGISAGDPEPVLLNSLAR